MKTSIGFVDGMTRGLPDARQERMQLLNRALHGQDIPNRSATISEPNSLPTLGNENGFWQLRWAGKQAAIKCEPGAFYVAALLTQPGSAPLSAFEVAATGTGLPCPCLDQPSALKAATAEAFAVWLRRIAELERILDITEHEPTKAEVTRELKAMYAWKPRQNSPVVQLSRAAELVYDAIFRLQQHLARATDVRGVPHPLLHRFAEHVRQFILVPSAACRPDFAYQPAS